CSAISGRDTLNMVVLRTEKKTMVARNTMSLRWAADPAIGMLPVKEPPARSKGTPPGD
ncbi:MAG: hypothetical protein JRD02_08610, partial [Deltaproteobacteria bacterium]|nr:hypothetical protein [Deltaproteobacteria bacterium]